MVHRWFLFRKLHLFALSVSLDFSALANEGEFQKNKEQLSQYVGYLMWKSLQEREFSYDLEEVISGIHKAERGEFTPLDEGKYQQLLKENELYIYEQKSKMNLLKAHAFLQQIKKEIGIYELKEDKLYYKIIASGHKENALQMQDEGLFHLRCYTLDGKMVIDTYAQDAPVVQNLKDAIEGFRHGVAGMKEGEERVLYIHPDFGYGNFRNDLLNTLLIVEVKLMEIIPPSQKSK